MLAKSGGLQMDTVQFLFVSSTETMTSSTWKQRDKRESWRNFKSRCLDITAAERKEKERRHLLMYLQKTWFLLFQVFIKATENSTPLASFGCKPEEQRALHGFAQQTLAEAESKPTKLTVNTPEFHLQVWTGGWMWEGDRQYLKCTNCSRSLCTTCTVSTLELQCRRCLQHESQRVISHRGKDLWLQFIHLPVYVTQDIQKVSTQVQLTELNHINVLKRKIWEAFQFGGEYR